MSRFVTLADLHRGDFNLHITCKGCGHVSTLMTWGVNGLVGTPGAYDESMETKLIVDVVARMKCSVCGGRDVEWTPQRSPQ